MTVLKKNGTIRVLGRNEAVRLLLNPAKQNRVWSLILRIVGVK